MYFTQNSTFWGTIASLTLALLLFYGTWYLAHKIKQWWGGR